MITINCLICGKEKKVYPYKLKEGKGKYCSLECSYRNPVNIERARNLGLLNIGRKCTEDSKIKKRIALIGRFTKEKNTHWKGSNVGYTAIHKWIRENYGSASKCVNGHIGKRYYWANISGEYKRDVDDYHQLCGRCNRLDGIHIAERFKEGGASISI